MVCHCYSRDSGRHNANAIPNIMPTYLASVITRVGYPLEPRYEPKSKCFGTHRPGQMPAPRVKSLSYVKLNGTSASTLEAVAKSRKSLNTSNGLALLLVFHEIQMVGMEGVEPSFVSSMYLRAAITL